MEVDGTKKKAGRKDKGAMEVEEVEEEEAEAGEEDREGGEFDADEVEQIGNLWFRKRASANNAEVFRRQA